MNTEFKTRQIIVLACFIISALFIPKVIVANTIDTIKYARTFDLIKVPVQIKGKTYNFIFDSGAQGTGIRSDIAEEMGTNTELSDTLYDAFKNKSIQNFYTIPQLQLGQSTLANLKTLVFPTNVMFEYLNIDGIIGMDVIMQFDWMIDFDKQLLVKIDTTENYHQKIKAFKSISLTVRDNVPTLSLCVGNKNIAFLLDTGATISDITEESYQSIKNKLVSEVKSISSAIGVYP